MITTKLSTTKLSIQHSIRRSGKLTIRLYKNHSGSASWRVTGTLHGERIRRNFRDRADALAEKRGLEIRFLQQTTGLREVGTFLSDSQLREAEALFLRLDSLRQQREQQARQEQTWRPSTAASLSSTASSKA